jgi:hypothetical protein
MSDSGIGMHVSHSEPRRSVRVSVPAGTSLNKVFAIEKLPAPFINPRRIGR